MIRELRLCKMEIQYGSIELNDGTTEKMITLLFFDEDGTVISLPLPECIFAKFASDLMIHFKEFKEWLDTGKLPTREIVDETENTEFKYHQ